MRSVRGRGLLFSLGSEGKADLRWGCPSSNMNNRKEPSMWDQVWALAQREQQVPGVLQVRLPLEPQTQTLHLKVDTGQPLVHPNEHEQKGEVSGHLVTWAVAEGRGRFIWRWLRDTQWLSSGLWNVKERGRGFIISDPKENSMDRWVLGTEKRILLISGIKWPSKWNEPLMK